MKNQHDDDENYVLMGNGSKDQKTTSARRRVLHLVLPSTTALLVSVLLGFWWHSSFPRSNSNNSKCLQDNGNDGDDNVQIECNANSSPNHHCYQLDRNHWLTQQQPAINFTKTLCDPLFEPSNTVADSSKPIQVFILLGQSNMVGMANVHGDADGSLEYAVFQKQRYQHLAPPQKKHKKSSSNNNNNNNNNWSVRHDIRNVHTMGEPGRIMKNEWLTVSGNHFGPDLQFGYVMAELLQERVLLLKSCIGNRALGWDLLPPGTQAWEFENYTYAGYGQGPAWRWPSNQTTPPPHPKPGDWYAGKEWDIDVANAKTVLSNLSQYYPMTPTDNQDYEIAGFLWWQGDRDRRVPAHAARYEYNLVRFIHQIRQAFEAPKAKFVLSTIGMGGYHMTGDTLKVAQAQLAVSGEEPAKYPEFRGNVKTVDMRSSYRVGDYHYGNNADTYMEVGNALGLAMAQLLFPEQ